MSVSVSRDEGKNWSREKKMRDTSSLIQGKRRSERDRSQRENMFSSLKTRVCTSKMRARTSPQTQLVFLPSIDEILFLQPRYSQDFYVCLPLTNFLSMFKDKVESSSKILFQFFVNTNLRVREWTTEWN